MRTSTAVLSLFVALVLLLVGVGSAVAAETTTTTVVTETTTTTVVTETTTTTVVSAPAGEPICVTCHSYVSADVVDTWRSQNHGRNGVACPACHGGHDKDFTPKPMAKVCFGCHNVNAAHPDFTPETPGKRCMECHTSNVHWLPGQQSWFQGGLPTSKLEQSTQKPSDVSASAGQATGVIVVIIAAIAGLIAGLIFNRFVREL